MFCAHASCAGLCFVFDEEHLVYDGHLVFERKIHERACHRLGDQAGMPGFTLQDDSQGKDGLKTVQFRRGLDKKGDLKGARRPEKDDIRSRLKCVEFRVGIVHEGLDKFLIEFAGDDRI